MTEVSVIWAYDLNWQPAPVFQNYQAYTDRLDGLNAAALSSSTGPAFVLRHVGAPADGRFESLEAPRTNVALMCDYAPAASDGSWLLLERLPASRCAEPELLTEQRVGAGETIPVPAVDEATEILLVSIEFDVGLLDRIQTALYKSDEYWLTVDGVRSRLLPRVTSSPGVLSASSAATGWDAPFLPIDHVPATITLDHAATVTFSAAAID